MAVDVNSYVLQAKAILPGYPHLDSLVPQWSRELHHMLDEYFISLADRVEQQVTIYDLGGQPPASVISPNGSRRLLVDLATRAIFVDKALPDGTAEWWSLGPECGDVTTNASGRASVTLARPYGTFPAIRPVVQLTPRSATLKLAARVYSWANNGSQYTGFNIESYDMAGTVQSASIMWAAHERTT